MTQRTLIPSRAILAGCCIIGLLAFSACKKKTTTTTTTTTTAVSLGPESYVVVAEGVIESGPTISGTLVPRQQAVVRAQIGGSVLRTFFEQGQRVGAGQMLAQIDPRALSDAVTSARLAVTNAQSNLDVMRREQSRQETLLKAGAISQQSVDMARKNTVAAEAALSQAKAQLASAEKQLSLASVTAPFSGVVSEKSASIGDVVQPGTPIYTIVDPSTLELQGTIPADALGMVHTGLPIKFNVTGYPNQQFTGTIARINPTADPTTRQVRIYAEIPNIGQTLVGGLYAEGRIGSVLKTAISLPTDAIDHRMITPAVEKLTGGVVTRTTVTLGTVDEQNNLVQVTSGVNPGDTVLRGSAMEIALGTHIRTIPNTATAPAGAGATGGTMTGAGSTTGTTGGTGGTAGGPSGVMGGTGAGLSGGAPTGQGSGTGGATGKSGLPTTP